MAIVKNNPYENKKEVKERDNNYISPAEFTKDIQIYYDLAEKVEKLDKKDKSPEAQKLRRDEKRALDKCGKFLCLMVKGLTNNGKFSGYTWKNDMMSDALVKCTRALVKRKYVINRKFSPFSYFNQIAFHEFIHRIKVEKKHVSTLEDYKAENYTNIKDETDIPIYLKPLYNETVKKMLSWNEEEANDSEMIEENYEND